MNRLPEAADALRSLTVMAVVCLTGLLVVVAPTSLAAQTTAPAKRLTAAVANLSTTPREDQNRTRIPHGRPRPATTMAADVAEIRARVFLSLLEVALAQDGRLNLVNRAQRDEILNELGIAASGLADPAQSLQLGKLLHTDITVCAQRAQSLHRAPQQAPIPDASDSADLLVIRVIDTLSGRVLGITALHLSDETLPTDAETTARYVENTAIKGHSGEQGNAATPSTTIAVGLFENASRFERLRPMEYLLRDMVTRRLEEDGGLCVLERSSMKPLIEELDLVRSALADDSKAPGELPQRQAAYMLEGSFREITDGKPTKLSVRVDIVGVDTGKTVDSLNLLADLDQWPLMCREISQQVRQRLGAVASSQPVQPPATSQPADTARGIIYDEAHDLLDRCVIDWARLGRYNDIPGFEGLHVNFAYVLNAADPLGNALVRRSVDRLQCALFLAPDEPRIKLLLADFYLGQDAWDIKTVEALLKDVAGADHEGLVSDCAYRRLQSAYGKAAGKDPSQAASWNRLAAGASVSAAKNAAKTPQLLANGKWESAACNAISTLWSIGEYHPAIEMADEYFKGMENQQPTFSTSSALPRMFWDMIRRATETTDLQPALQAMLERGSKCRNHEIAYQCQMALGALADPRGAVIWLRFAPLPPTVANQDGDAAKALESYQAAGKIGRDDGDTRMQLFADEAAARALSSLGRDQDAIALLEGDRRQIAQRHWMPAARALAELYDRVGHRDKADATYMLFPDDWFDPEVQTRIAALKTAVSKAPPPTTHHVARMSVQKFSNPAGLPRLAVAGGDGFWCIINDQLHHFDADHGQWSAAATLSQPIKVTALAQTSGHVWLGARSGGLWSYDTTSKTWKHITAAEGLPDERITALHGDGDDLYIGAGGQGNGGLARMAADGSFHLFDQRGAPALPPTSISATPAHILAADELGVHIFTRASGRWRKVGEHREHACVTCGADHALAVISGTPAFFDAEGARVDIPISIQQESHALFVEVRCIAEGGGRIWLGSALSKTTTTTIYSMEADGSKLEMFDADDGCDFTRVDDLLWSRDRLWAATDTGFFCISPTPSAPPGRPATGPAAGQ